VTFISELCREMKSNQRQWDATFVPFSDEREMMWFGVQILVLLGISSNSADVSGLLVLR
jgi:hypothetical protein